MKDTFGNELTNRLKTDLPKFLGLGHLFSTAKYSLDGFKACFKSEAAFRQELFLGFVNLLAVILLPISLWLRLYLTSIWFILICVELLNTAIESIVNLVSPEWNALAKLAKDLGSAAVLCILVLFCASWLVVILYICFNICY